MVYDDDIRALHDKVDGQVAQIAALEQRVTDLFAICRAQHEVLQAMRSGGFGNTYDIRNWQDDVETLLQEHRH